MGIYSTELANHVYEKSLKQSSLMPLKAAELSQLVLLDFQSEFGGKTWGGTDFIDPKNLLMCH